MNAFLKEISIAQILKSRAKCQMDVWKLKNNFESLLCLIYVQTLCDSYSYDIISFYKFPCI